MIEKWQLFDEKGKALKGQGAEKDEVFSKGILHGASHVWIWRKSGDKVQILLQKRAPNKRTWPNLLDISAAGHIDLGETPEQAAIRETQEEIGLDIKDSDLNLIFIERRNIIAPGGSIENEFCWVYILEAQEVSTFVLQESEVALLDWKNLDDFKIDVLKNDAKNYVPQGLKYYKSLITYINKTTKLS